MSQTPSAADYLGVENPDELYRSRVNGPRIPQVDPRMILAGLLIGALCAGLYIVAMPTTLQDQTVETLQQHIRHNQSALVTMHAEVERLQEEVTSLTGELEVLRERLQP